MPGRKYSLPGPEFLQPAKQPSNTPMNLSPERHAGQPLIDTRLIDGAVDIEPFDPFPGPCGAEDIFIGRTRVEDHPTYGRLKYLEYEAYRPMCEQLLHDMAAYAVKTYDCHAVRIVHAVGRVDPGEASVVIQVATPHRGESFQAARYLIDRLKHELPIWKREHWEKGTTFVEGCCAHHPDDRKLVDPDAPWPAPQPQQSQKTSHPPHESEQPHDQ